MKVLIWVVCFFCSAVTQVIIKEQGIILGGIPTALLFGATWFVAKKLCDLWDKHEINKKQNMSLCDESNDPPNIKETVQKVIIKQEEVMKKESNKGEANMFCQYCGKQIAESADVCIGCGKLLKQEKKINGQCRVLMPLSILVLVFSSMFFVIGIISFFVGIDNGGFFGFYYSRDSYWTDIQTYSFVSLIVALMFESCSAILSLILLVFNSKKVINIVSFSISMGLMAFVGIIVFCAGI